MTARILIIDDDLIIRKIITATLTSQGYEIIAAEDGGQGFNLAQTARPDVIITDVMMPTMDGYELTRRLRRDPAFAQTPILILTSKSQLEEKLKGFEAGATDYMGKPFEPAELAARVGVLLRQTEMIRTARAQSQTASEPARFIAVHSLRGGLGCSSLAVNLALGLTGLWRSAATWENPTLLMDLVLTAGQAALMLDMPLRRTWADLAGSSAADLDEEFLRTIISEHTSGLHFIAAPTYPSESENLSSEQFNAVLRGVRFHYDYIVADLGHDFSELALQALDEADIILLLLAPELASLRAAAAALDTYSKLKYGLDKIKLVLNWTFQNKGFARKDIEAALHLPISFVLPFAPDKLIEAINHGQPVLYSHPEDPLAALIEDFAFSLGKERHRTLIPSAPSAAWQRVNKRLTAGARK